MYFIVHAAFVRIKLMMMMMILYYIFLQNWLSSILAILIGGFNHDWNHMIAW